MTDYKWLPQALSFIDEYGADPEMIEAAVAHPTSTGIHPQTAEVGYEILSYRRGDLEVCVSNMDPKNPAIAYVYLHLPLDQQPQHAKGPKGNRDTGAKDAPRSLRQLYGRIHAAGYRIDPGGHHPKVVRQDGSYVMSLPSTPSAENTLSKYWTKFRREVTVDLLRELAEESTPPAPEGPEAVSGK